MTHFNRESVSCILLAGGEGKRMGGSDKGLVPFLGIPLVQHVIARIRPQVKTIIINANRNLETYAHYGLAMVKDHYAVPCGPLAGFAAGMEVAKTPYVITTPCDSPLIPSNLVARLSIAREENKVDLTVVETDGKMQPVFSLIKVSLLDSLLRFIETGGRKIDRWYEQIDYASVDFSEDRDCFRNINTLEDLHTLEKDRVLPV